MHRFYIPPRVWNSDRLTLDAAEAHHALDVLRLEIGSRVTVFNGQGSEALADITGATRDSVTLRIVQAST